MNKPKKRNRDYLTVTVPFAATQTVEPPPKQQWAHPLVWTESMRNSRPKRTGLFLFVALKYLNQEVTRLAGWGIPAVRDRVVQTALLHVLEPIYDISFHDRSFGFRRGLGCIDALRCVEELLNKGYVYVVDADLRSYFDTIPRDRLLAMLQQKVSDSAVIRLIKKYLVARRNDRWQVVEHGRRRLCLKASRLG